MTACNQIAKITKEQFSKHRTRRKVSNALRSRPSLVTKEMLADVMKGIWISSALCLLIVAGGYGDTGQRRAIAAAAESQAGVTPHYDPSYVKLKYPGGDVPVERGVCADVVVRAFRKIGVDLQVSLHEDMSRDFRAYPQRWRLRGPDSNIDHRRLLHIGVVSTQRAGAGRQDCLSSKWRATVATAAQL